MKKIIAAIGLATLSVLTYTLVLAKVSGAPQNGGLAHQESINPMIMNDVSDENQARLNQIKLKVGNKSSVSIVVESSGRAFAQSESNICAKNRVRYYISSSSTTSP